MKGKAMKVDDQLKTGMRRQRKKERKRKRCGRSKGLRMIKIQIDASL